MCKLQAVHFGVSSASVVVPKGAPASVGLAGGVAGRWFRLGGTEDVFQEGESMFPAFAALRIETKLAMGRNMGAEWKERTARGGGGGAFKQHLDWGATESETNLPTTLPPPPCALSRFIKFKKRT